MYNGTGCERMLQNYKFISVFSILLYIILVLHFLLYFYSFRLEKEKRDKSQ